jgi:hypothetical protein
MVCRPPPLSGIDELSIMVYVIQDLGIEVEVIDNDIRLLEAFKALDCQKTDISGTCTD